MSESGYTIKDEKVFLSKIGSWREKKSTSIEKIVLLRKYWKTTFNRVNWGTLNKEEVRKAIREEVRREIKHLRKSPPKCRRVDLFEEAKAFLEKC